MAEMTPEQLDELIASSVENFMTYAMEKELTPEVFTYILSHTLCETIITCYDEPKKVLEEMIVNIRTLMSMMSGEITPEQLQDALASVERSVE
jgi:hypothetical protein